jgi:hypothetical protein
MRCERCKRPIFKDPAATVRTRGGVKAYGPKCASLMGLTETAARARAMQVTPRRRKTADEAQLELELETEEVAA